MPNNQIPLRPLSNSADLAQNIVFWYALAISQNLDGMCLEGRAHTERSQDSTTPPVFGTSGGRNFSFYKSSHLANISLT